MNGTTASNTSNGVVSSTEDEYIEEDWSEYIQDDATDLCGFARHDDRCMISILPNLNLSIASVECLSPIDMINLSWGTKDDTGHRVWMGALLWTKALPMVLEEYLNRKNVVELGCGTGVSGLAALRLFHPKFMLFTDASEAALRLTRQNCRYNLPAIGSAEIVVQDGELTKFYEDGFDKKWGVHRLEWGKLSSSSLVNPSSLFDTVIATDVLYDVASLVPLLETTFDLLKDGGSFLLSHVPRCAIPSDSNDDESHQDNSITTLERQIIQEAKNLGLQLTNIVRPIEILRLLNDDQGKDFRQGNEAMNVDICQITTGISATATGPTLKDMHESGAAILAFTKTQMQHHWKGTKT